MQLAALAFDYDGTLARDGRVDAPTIAALRRLKASGRRLLLVSGREFEDLRGVFDETPLFDAIVAENGALLCLPGHEARPLGPAPPTEFVTALRAAGVSPLSIGRSIVATWEPNEAKVLAAIQACRLEWQIIFNKGAVMCLPPGVNKASGLLAALAALNLSPLNVLGVGDAENDHAFLSACGASAAVANALDTVKAAADIVTECDHGAGVVEIIDRLLDEGPAALTAKVRRHDIRLGVAEDGEIIGLPPDSVALLLGGSGTGKSRLAAALMEKVHSHGFQYCVVDPEGDYDALDGAIVLGGADRPVLAEEAAEALAEPTVSLVANLLGLGPGDRIAFLAALTAELTKLRSAFGRPHWLIIDEAHQFYPGEATPPQLAPEAINAGTVLVTLSSEGLAPAVRASANAVLAVGSEAANLIAAHCRTLSLLPPPFTTPPGDQEAFYWDRRIPSTLRRLRVEPPPHERQRHARKYAEGRLGEDKSFYFRGPKGELNLRAANLSAFLDLAIGVDDATWLFHLRRHDISSWFRAAIGDPAMAEGAQTVEARLGEDPKASREAIRRLVSNRYAAAAPKP